MTPPTFPWRLRRSAPPAARSTATFLWAQTHFLFLCRLMGNQNLPFLQSLIRSLLQSTATWSRGGGVRPHPFMECSELVLLWECFWLICICRCSEAAAPRFVHHQRVPHPPPSNPHYDGTRVSRTAQGYTVMGCDVNAHYKKVCMWSSPMSSASPRCVPWDRGRDLNSSEQEGNDTPTVTTSCFTLHRVCYYAESMSL